MTWTELAIAIAAMPAEAREKPVKFVEPYDDAAIHLCMIFEATELIVDEDGDTIEEGDAYLA